MPKMMDSSFLSRICQIVVVGQHAACYEQLSDILAGEGFQLFYRRPDELIEFLDCEWIDAIILDDSLSPRTGKAVCRMIRRSRHASMVPILITPDHEDSSDMVENLRAGADDFLQLDLQRALVAGRIKTLIRRASARCEDDIPVEPLSNLIKAGDMIIKVNEYQVYTGDTSLALSVSEFRLLLLLASKPKQVFTREEIEQAIMPEGEALSRRALDARIYTLRQKLGRVQHYIRTVRGVGFMFDALPRRAEST